MKKWLPYHPGTHEQQGGKQKAVYIMEQSSSASLKQCPGPCKQLLPATPEFFSKGKNKDGFQSLCKACSKEYKRQHYLANKEEITKKHKEYAESHKEQDRERSKRYVESHKEHLREYHQRYYEEHRDLWIEKGSQRYQTKREQILEQARQYRNKNRERRSARIKQYRITHREEVAARRRKYYHEHREHCLAQKRRDYEKHKEQRLENSKVYRKTERGRLIRRASWHKREAQKLSVGGFYTSAQILEQLRRQRNRCYYPACGRSKFQKVNGKYVYHIEHVVPLSRGGSNSIDNLVLSCPTCNLRKGTKLLHEWGDNGMLL
jgi:HNH endonuclease